MKLLLIVQAGPDSGRRFSVAAGQEHRVGRESPCEIRVPGDAMMSNPHFIVKLSDTVATVRDAGSKFGTFCNDVRITDAELRAGDVIRAGKSEFRVQYEESAKPDAPQPVAPSVPKPETRSEEIYTGLSKTSRTRDLLGLFKDAPNLFAILDAARNLAIPNRLAESDAQFQSLYETDDLDIMGQGPWLVRLKPDSKLLPELVREGWGDSWGVYFTSDAQFEEVRHHLRRYLTIMLPDKKPVLFRFYDPRVLRVYLPTCTSSEAQAFFGPVRGYFCEDKTAADVLLFHATQREPVRFPVVVSEAPRD